MVDHLNQEQRSRLMQKVKGTDTKPEKAVRSLLHRLGYRFRLHRKDLPGTPDIVFSPRRKIIFVHGCYWHGHGCSKGQLPKSRLDYWEPKIARNRQRDAEKLLLLSNLGWDVLTVWQCELRDTEALGKNIVDFLDR